MIKNILRGLLIFGGCYFIFDAVLHFSGLKLVSVEDQWSPSALSYAQLINFIYASLLFLAASMAFIIQKDLKKYQAIVLVSAAWAFFHGMILLFLVWGHNYQKIFQEYNSLLIWLPFYREYITGNSLLLFLYSGIALVYLKKDR